MKTIFATQGNGSSTRPALVLLGAILLGSFALLCLKGPSFSACASNARMNGKTLLGGIPELTRSSVPMGIVGAYHDADLRILPRAATTFQQFLVEIKQSLDLFELQLRPVEAIFNSSTYFVDIPHPACTGTWMEFGVFNGNTINMTSLWRETHCGRDSDPVFGFDTFTGLPEEWRTGFGSGAFSLGGNFPAVRDNVNLVKGLFSDSLPGWLNSQDKAHRGRMPDASYIHIDCDLYAGAHDALTLLANRIAPGCILIFDDLLHYPDYKQHEVLALWEFVQATGRKVAVIGKKGPLPGTKPGVAVDLTASSDYDWPYQSAAFVVL